MKNKEEVEDERSIRSRRKYLEKICGNPNCDLETKKFFPYDRRMKFHSKQCRINFYNDQRYSKNNSDFKNEKLLREYDKKLEKIYAAYVDGEGHCAAPLNIFQYERIDVRLLVQQQENTTTKGTVRWFYRFGTELHPKNNQFIIIYKKQTQ